VPVKTPLEFEIEPQDGYIGLPPEMYLGETFLMSGRLIKVLKEAGVNNMDCFEAILTNTETGEKLGYQAVNIIGAIAAADLKKSDWENYDGEAKIDTFFNKLVINGAKGGNLLLFRLAESLSKIIVHEKVKDHLIASGIDTMIFLNTD